MTTIAISPRIYVGNRRKHGGDCAVYVGRPESPLGNPWSHKPSKYAERVPSLKLALDNYAIWLSGFLWSEIRGPVREEFDRCKELLRTHGEVHLLCFCVDALRPPVTPPQCHADIIAAMLLREVGDRVAPVTQLSLL